VKRKTTVADCFLLDVCARGVFQRPDRQNQHSRRHAEDRDLQAISNQRDAAKKLAMYLDFVQKYSSNPAAVAYGNWQISQAYQTSGDLNKRSTTAIRRWLGRRGAWTSWYRRPVSRSRRRIIRS